MVWAAAMAAFSTTRRNSSERSRCIVLFVVRALPTSNRTVNLHRASVWVENILSHRKLLDQVRIIPAGKVDRTVVQDEPNIGCPITVKVGETWLSPIGFHQPKKSLEGDLQDRAERNSLSGPDDEFFA